VALLVGGVTQKEATQEGVAGQLGGASEITTTAGLGVREA
jgi:hypothetical protein